MSMPATRPDDDLYITIISNDNGGVNNINLLTGWTQILRTGTGSSGCSMMVAWRKGSSEPATYTWTGGNEKYAGAILRISGADTDSPVDAQGNTVHNPTTDPTCPSITVNSDDTLVLRLLAGDGDVADATPTTELWKNAATGTGKASSAGSKENGPASGNTTGVATFTDASNDQYVGHTLAIAAAVSAPSGAGAQTLGALTQAGLGDMLPEGAGAQTLAALTQAGTGVQVFSSTGAQTLAAVLQAGVGDVPGAAAGTGAQTLASVTQAGAGVQIYTGAGVQTLAALIQLGAGVAPFIGTGAQVLAALLQAGVGVHSVGATATGAQALAPAVQAGTGVQIYTGTGAHSLAAATQAGAGVQVFSAAGVQALAALSQAGAGVQAFVGAGVQALAAITQAGAGVAPFAGTAAQTLAAVLQAGVGVTTAAAEGPGGVAAAVTGAAISTDCDSATITTGFA